MTAPDPTPDAAQSQAEREVVRLCSELIQIDSVNTGDPATIGDGEARAARYLQQKLDEARLKAQLTLAGYNHVTQVVSPGEYAVRGGLIDLFPMGSPVPYRVDLFDDEVDSIRTFDPDSQRSLYPVPEVRLLPGREFPMDEAARTMFRQRWREKLDGDPTKSRIYKDIAQGIATAGISVTRPGTAPAMPCCRTASRRAPTRWPWR